jgi:glycosyltransferase involved in cell wall biosynthesis
MRILTCCNVYPPKFLGGAELVAHYQAKALQAAGHQVQVFAGLPDSGRLQYRLKHDFYDGLAVDRVHLAPTDYRSDYVNFVHPQVEEHFTKVLADFRPDVVHFHNVIGLSVSLIRLAHEFGARTILTVHDHWGFCFKNTLMKTEGVTCTDFTRCDECQPFIDDGAQRQIPMRFRQDYFELAIRDIDAFVSPSRYLAGAYIKAGVPASKLHVIRYGIDSDTFARGSRIPGYGRVRFSFIGYFGKHKGVSTILTALSLMKQPHSIRLNLVGEGEESEAYKKQLCDRPYAEFIKFWGKVDNNHIRDVYRETDILILPSIWPENHPVSITEAMSSGIPVIASRIGGIPELVEDGITGFLFEPGDPADLAAKMDRFVAEPALLDTLGRNGRVRMRDNSYREQVQKILHVYESINNQSITTARTSDRALIACVGKRISGSCNEALHLLHHYLTGAPPRIVMAAWLTAAQMRGGLLIWVVDDAVLLEPVVELARHGIALLVPEASQKLATLCRTEACGLYYRDGHEAAAMLAYLVDNPEQLNVLGRNASKLVGASTPHLA